MGHLHTFAVFREGTVPVALAEVTHVDIEPAVLERAKLSTASSPSVALQLETWLEGEAPCAVENNAVEFHTVALVGPLACVGLTWFDGEGFTLTGFTSFDEGLKWLQEPPYGVEVSPIDVSPNDGPRHFSVTYGEGDNEGYGHLFVMPGA